MELYVTSHLRHILEGPRTSISSSLGLRIRETIRKKSLRISAWERCWKMYLDNELMKELVGKLDSCFAIRLVNLARCFFFRHLFLQKTSWKPILEMQIFLKICKGCCILGFGILNGIPTLRIRFFPQKLLFWGPKTPLRNTGSNPSIGGSKDS